jgi:putative SOS response-associated peptidase YedK
VILEDNPNQIVLAHWGYPIHIGLSEKELINVRAESIETKPFFKKAALKHRCIVLADGFYEWKKEAGKKQPYKLTINHTPMAMAGIYKWQEKKLTGEMLPFFSIVTVPPNDFMKDIHDRMPVILEIGKEKNWLISDSIDRLLKTYAHKMFAEPVSI